LQKDQVNPLSISRQWWRKFQRFGIKFATIFHNQKRDGKGLAYGLSITHDIVKAHGKIGHSIPTGNTILQNPFNSFKKMKAKKNQSPKFTPKK